jgi:hypothetical protein
MCENNEGKYGILPDENGVFPEIPGKGPGIGSVPPPADGAVRKRHHPDSGDPPAGTLFKKENPGLGDQPIIRKKK